jgi:hypothetical protein
MLIAVLAALGSVAAPSLAQRTPDEIAELERWKQTEARVDAELLTTGRDLANACDDAGDLRYRCHSFIRGVLSAYSAGIHDAGGTLPFCPPERFMAAYYLPAVEGFIESHPALSNIEAERVVILAMVSAFPCSISN